MAASGRAAPNVGPGVALPGRDDISCVADRPVPEGGERTAQGRPQGRQPILDPGRDLGIYLPGDQAVFFEMTQRLGKHLVADALDLVADRGEAVGTPVGELPQHQDGPFTADAIEQITRGAFPRIRIPGRFGACHDVQYKRLAANFQVGTSLR
jgi:hypothetical protein